MSFPPPPTPTIDWSNVGFKVRDVNGHIESHFSPSTNQWSAPKFIRSPYLRLHGMSPALNYGQQAYEGLKAFRHSTAPSPNDPTSTEEKPSKITLFRPDLNAARLAHSAQYVSIPPVPAPIFTQAVQLAVSTNAEFVPPAGTLNSALYIRPLIFGSSAQLGLSPPEEYTFAVFVTPTGVYHGAKAVDALIVEDFDRAAPRGTGSAKVGGNYAPVLRHSGRAGAEGFGITLHLDSATRGDVEEFSTSAFVGVLKDGDGKVTLVRPDSTSVIESVTAASVCEIGEKLFGYRVEKRRVPYEEIALFKEVFAAGTAAALVPVRSITARERGDKWEFECGGEGEGGEVCVKLLNALKGIQAGTVEDPFGWNVEVGAPPEGCMDGGEDH
ncbi:branched-chain amino acid aminotransferase II [Aspergillus campestris IBT 28561]|uniref:Branched-chain amino acid aminotransferase II n=1 Tax=Aspergillus campestris (strain IBT 28561) TaxID=1392248 RepID=A0A2I1D489_ASPC2|nr:branched-chain amino acid aminotransferase II [Aspergillus campestris IBT 28561]PKY04685.1 branched-chain amino acid aminotransferase II [Aspergillus campestris IBT 28561]